MEQVPQLDDVGEGAALVVGVVGEVAVQLLVGLVEELVVARHHRVAGEGVGPGADLLEDLQDELNLTYVMIAHDLSVVRHVSDRVAVMYLGRIVELGERDDVYDNPRHPYTKAMLSAVPVPDTSRRENRERIRLQGDVPSPINPPTGCHFHTRCWKAQDICKTVVPPLETLAPKHQAACHFPEDKNKA